MVMQQRIDGMRVAILVTTDFEQIEMTEPRKALDAAGAKTMLISTERDETNGFHHDRMGDSFKVDLPLEQANPDDFDAVLVPGGALNADALRVNAKAQEFVRRIDETNRPMAAICHAPWLLVSAGLTHGRTLTSWPTIRDDLRNAGARWLDQEVVRDRNLVTSRGPKDIPAFNRGMIELFSEYAPQRGAEANGQRRAQAGLGASPGG
jgi:protease I